LFPEAAGYWSSKFLFFSPPRTKWQLRGFSADSIVLSRQPTVEEGRARPRLLEREKTKYGSLDKIVKIRKKKKKLPHLCGLLWLQVGLAKKEKKLKGEN